MTKSLPLIYPSIRWKDLSKKGKEKQIPLKDDDKDKIEELTDKLKAAMKMKENAKTTEAKLLSASAIEEAKSAIKLVPYTAIPFPPID